jgi:hypothetical protein
MDISYFSLFIPHETEGIEYLIFSMRPYPFHIRGHAQGTEGDQVTEVIPFAPERSALNRKGRGIFVTK